MTELLSPPLAGPAYTPAATAASPSQSVDRSRVLGWLAIVSAALFSIYMLWTRRDYIPIWDGRIYADCVVAASRNLLDVTGYRCAGHISQGYIVFLALAQKFAPTSPVPMMVMNALLLGAGAFALYRILRAVLPSAEHELGRSLVVAAFLVHPLVVVSVVQPGLDFGVMIFSLCAVAALLEGRRWLMIAFGVLLVFTKEPGVLLYAVLMAVYLWRHELRRLIPNGAYWLGVGGCAIAIALNITQISVLSALVFAIILAVLLSRRLPATQLPLAQIGRIVRAQQIIALPLVVVLGYMTINALRRSTHATMAPVLWANTGSDKLLGTIIRAGLVDPPTRSALALIFIIGFLWIPSAITALDVAIAAVRHRKGRPARALPGIDGEALGMLIATFIGFLWFLTRYQTFSNARYYLPLYPIALVIAYASLVRLGVMPRVRHLVNGALVLLLALSVDHTIDPVSRWLWGTFPVGDRTLLYATSLTRECCGGGRDQLGYNLEFTNLDVLTNKALAVIRPEHGSVLVMPAPGDWQSVGPLDATTRQRTLATTNVVEPWVLSAGIVYQHSKQLTEAWYLEVPYLENSWSLNKLSKYYDISEPAWVEHDGYAMAVRRLRARKQ